LRTVERSKIFLRSSPFSIAAERSYMACQTCMRSSFFRNGVASSSVAYSRSSGAYSLIQLLWIISLRRGGSS